jgi:cell division protein FtsB
MFGDLTRPIPTDKRLVTGRAKRGAVALGALVITTALVAALFVLPVKAWLRQRDDIAVKDKELSTLDQANAQLTDEVGRLQTPEGIKEAAREEIGYVQRGEIRLTMLPSPKAPITMPSGWPYDIVAQIVAVGTASANAGP